MTFALNKRRLGFGFLGLALGLLALLLGARLTLTGLAVNTLLQRAGAAEIKFNVIRASPWRVDLENIEFQVRAQTFAARRASMVRAHWWTPSLGTVRVEQARVPLNIDGSDTNPSAWSTYKPGAAAAPSLSLPAEEISIDGQLLIQAAALPEQALVVKIEARLTAGNRWQGSMHADGPGLKLRSEGLFTPAKSELGFKLTELTLDLQPWQNFLQRVVLLPGGALEMAGRISATAEGSYQGKALLAAGTVHLREGRVKNELRGVSAEGVEADLEFVDFSKFLSKPGSLRVRELRTGQLVARALDAEFAFEGATQIAVSRATLQTLGGRLTAEPFKYFTNLREVAAVLLVEGIKVEEVMALTRDLPANASGRVDGRLPVRIDGSGLRLGTGWLALMPGVSAQIQFNATGLLTGGINASSPTYAVLKKIEAGLLKLKITEMRLEIRPPDAPPGRSAQLHLKGEPVDPDVKAPVTLDLNVNGPIEKLLNLGLDSRMNFGSKR